MRSYAWFASIVVAALALSAGLADAGEQKDDKIAPKVDLPGPVHKQLSTLAGDWDVTTKFKIGDKENEGKAKCVAKPILGGRFLQQEYQSKLQGEPFMVLQILGYDNKKQKSIEIMMDSMGTSVLHNEGSVSADGKVITNEGESLDPATKKPYKLRTVTTIIDDDHFTIEWFKLDPDGAKERVVTLSHSRTKA